MLKIAIAGLGAAARTIHVPAYRGLSGVELIGGYDPAGPGNIPNLPTFPTLDALLEQGRPDILVVATPTSSHFEIADAALRAGVNVLCEKPFASTVEEAHALVRLAHERRLLIAVNNEYRFMRCHRAAREMIGTPDFGELLFVNMAQSFYHAPIGTPSWRDLDNEHTCKEFGTHVFDLCRYFFVAEPLRLKATMPRPGSGEGPDLLNLIDVEFPDHKFARITLDRLSRGRHRYLDVRLDGSRASIETEIGGRLALSFGLNARTRRPFANLEVSASARATLYQGESHRTLAKDPHNLFAAATAQLMQGYLTALHGGGMPPCSGADNLKSFAMMRAAYESARSGESIDLGFLQTML